MAAVAKTGWSDRVRQVATRDYVEPARGTTSAIRIPFGELKRKLVRMGFPPGHANQVASPLESSKFWKPLKLEMCTPKGQSRSVDSVLEFRFLMKASEVQESPAEKAFRLTSELRGLLKEEIAAHGGAEGFLKWVRSDEDEV